MCADPRSMLAGVACCTKTQVTGWTEQKPPSGAKLVVAKAATCNSYTACGSGTSTPRWSVTIENLESQDKKGTVRADANRRALRCEIAVVRSRKNRQAGWRELAEELVWDFVGRGLEWQAGRADMV